MRVITTTSQGAGPRVRRRPKTSIRQAILFVETLEARQLLAVAVTSTTPIPAPLWTPTDTYLADAQNGPMANLGTGLVSIYQSYTTGIANATAAGTLTTTALKTAVAAKVATQYPISGSTNGLVGMDIKSLGGDFGQFVSQLTAPGHAVRPRRTRGYGDRRGAGCPSPRCRRSPRLPQTLSRLAHPIPRSNHLDAAFQGYQGVAYNEPETSLGADAARSQYQV